MEGSNGVSQSFLQYGAIGAMLLVTLATLLWILRTLFSRFLAHMDSFQTFMSQTVTSLQKLNDHMDDNHREVMTVITYQRHPTQGKRPQGGG